MADKKISELNSASLPLAGTEVIPIVQGSETKKVPISEFKDVIEGYFNGTNFYTDALFTNLITPESSKIYLNLAVTPATQYRWSGSAYVQVGGLDIKEKRLMRWWAVGGTTATSLNQFGALFDYPLIYTGTKTNPLTYGVTSTLVTSIARLVYRSGAAIGSSCGFKTGRDSVLPFTTYTGYDLIICFDTSNLTSISTSRISAGITRNVADIGNINPSSLLNSILVGNDTGDTNLWLMHNDSTGTCTRFNLGANFPHNTENVFYKLFLKAEPMATKVFWKLERYQNTPILSTPIHTIEGIINSDLPAAGLLCWFVHRDNDTTASAVEVGISYVENKLFY